MYLFAKFTLFYANLNIFWIPTREWQKNILFLLCYYFSTQHKKRKTKLPFSQCDPGGTQTRDTQNRNLMLYSTELRGLHFSGAKIGIKGQQAKFDADKAKKLFNLLVITYKTRIFADIKG